MEHPCTKGARVQCLATVGNCSTKSCEDLVRKEIKLGGAVNTVTLELFRIDRYDCNECRFAMLFLCKACTWLRRPWRPAALHIDILWYRLDWSHDISKDQHV